jgi:hypothetical protein
MIDPKYYSKEHHQWMDFRSGYRFQVCSAMEIDEEGVRQTSAYVVEDRWDSFSEEKVYPYTDEASRKEAIAKAYRCAERLSLAWIKERDERVGPIVLQGNLFDVANEMRERWINPTKWAHIEDYDWDGYPFKMYGLEVYLDGRVKGQRPCAGGPHESHQLGKWRRIQGDYWLIHFHVDTPVPEDLVDTLNAAAAERGEQFLYDGWKLLASIEQRRVTAEQAEEYLKAARLRDEAQRLRGSLQPITVTINPMEPDAPTLKERIAWECSSPSLIQRLRAWWRNLI